MAGAEHIQRPLFFFSVAAEISVSKTLDGKTTSRPRNLNNSSQADKAKYSKK